MKQFLLVTKVTFLELWRQPAVLGVMGLAIVATSGGWWWRDFEFEGNETRFLFNFASGVQGLFVALLCIAGLAHTWSREFEQNTLLILRSRAVHPLSLVTGKTVGVWLMGAVFLVVSSVWLVFTIRTEVSLAEWRWYSMDVSLRAGKMALIAACATWFASYGKSLLFVALASSSVVVAGNLHGLIDAEGASGRLLKLVVPDLRWVDSVPMTPALLMDWGDWGIRFIYVLIYAVILTGLAAWSLSRHED